MTTSVEAVSIRRARSPRVIFRETGRYTILCLASIVVLFPIFWIVLNALKPGVGAAEPFTWPDGLTLDNVVRAWTAGEFGRYIGNSLVYCVTIVAGILVLSSLGGYAFGVLRFKGSTAVFLVYLVGLMIPFQTVMIPEYVLVRDLGLLGTMWGFILPAASFGLGLGTFLMRSFFRNIPVEIFESARMDGANEFRVFARIALPLAGPGLATLAIIQFIWIWKAYLMPLVLVQRSELRPVSLGLMFFSSQYTIDVELIAAGISLMTIPMIVIFVFFQRHITNAFVQGALK